MLQFSCDWCGRLKEPEETWILGYAAESVGAKAARREVTVLSGWNRERAVHLFAVHFCCEDHKSRYMAELFETTPQPGLEVVRTRRTSVREKVLPKKPARRAP